VTANQDTPRRLGADQRRLGRLLVETELQLGEMPTDLVAADSNGEGEVDLAVSIFSPPSVRLLLGDGSGGCTPATS
jgi:hypothetical protein